MVFCIPEITFFRSLYYQQKIREFHQRVFLNSRASLTTDIPKNMSQEQVIIIPYKIFPNSAREQKTKKANWIVPTLPETKNHTIFHRSHCLVLIFTNYSRISKFTVFNVEFIEVQNHIIIKNTRVLCHINFWKSWLWAKLYICLNIPKSKEGTMSSLLRRIIL